MKAEPRALVHRDRVLGDALRDERVLESELQAAMRANGVARYEDAHLIVLETDGTFTVVTTLPEDEAVLLEHVVLPQHGDG